MPYKFDYRGGDVLAWTLTEDGAEPERIEGYSPTIYVSVDSPDHLSEARQHLHGFPTVERTAIEFWQTGFRHDAEDVLRVDVDGIDSVTTVASTISSWNTPGTCYRRGERRRCCYRRRLNLLLVTGCGLCNSARVALPRPFPTQDSIIN